MFIFKAINCCSIVGPFFNNEQNSSKYSLLKHLQKSDEHAKYY